MKFNVQAPLKDRRDNPILKPDGTTWTVGEVAVDVLDNSPGGPKAYRLAGKIEEALLAPMPATVDEAVAEAFGEQPRMVDLTEEQYQLLVMATSQVQIKAMFAGAFNSYLESLKEG